MRIGLVAKFLFAEMILIMLSDTILSTSSSYFGLDYEYCSRQNGTVCNQVTSDECNFDESELEAGQENLAINPEDTFLATVQDRYKERRLTYLKLEWIQAFGNRFTPILVRVTQQLNRNVMSDHVICMSNFGNENTTVEQISGLDVTTKQSTVVPLIENATSVWVEVKTTTTLSKYRVDVSKFRQYSYILRSVSITTQENNINIVLTSPYSTTVPREKYEIYYTLTLLCYTYLKGDNHKQTPTWSPLKILPSSVALSNCSNSREEIQLYYSPALSQPIVYEMDRMAYEIVIDAVLVYRVNQKYIGDTSMKTLLFGHPESYQVEATRGMETATKRSFRVVASKEQLNNIKIPVGRTAERVSKIHSTTIKASISSSLERTIFNAMPIYQEPDSINANKSNHQLTSTGNASASALEQDQNHKKDMSGIISGTSIACTAFIFVIVFLIVKFRLKNTNRNSAKKMTTSEKYIGINRHHRKNSERLFSVSKEKQSIINYSRKSPAVPDCCTNQNSGTSNENVTDVLIASASSDTLNHKYKTGNSYGSNNDLMNTKLDHKTKQNDLTIEFTLSNVHEDFLQNFQYNILLNGKTPRKDNDEMCKVTDSVDDINYPRTGERKVHNRHYQSQYRRHQLSGRLLGIHGSRSIQDSASTWTNSMTNLPQNNTSCDNISEQEIDWAVLNEPEIFASSLQSFDMEDECLKINMTYEELTRQTTLDDECFSIVDSIAC